MTTPEKAFTLAWFPKISVLVAVALGVLFTEPPLATDRVIGVGGADEKGANGPVRLRYLWEDPLADIPENPAVDSYKPLAGALEDVGRVLFVGVEGGKRPTSLEMRIRTRIAVSSAICGKMNYIPKPPEDEPNQLSVRRINIGGTYHPVVVECFRGVGILGATDKGAIRGGSVAVVYVDELRIPPEISNLRWLIHSASGGSVPFPGGDEPIGLISAQGKEFSYIGPVRSSSLSTMVGSSSGAVKPTADFPYPVRLNVYSASASIDLGTKLSGEEPISLSYGSNFAVNLHRIGADDGMVADALAEELRLRGVVAPHVEEKCGTRGEPRDAVLILADMDQLHTSGLVRSFTRSWFEGREAIPGQDEVVRVIRYPEALDSLKGGPEKPAADGKTPANPSVWSSNIHAAEGFSQYDAVRRLPERLLQMQESDNVRYRAFGFFGSDPHDKILLMRALKNSFSEAAFFTNDVDALFWQGKDRKCTQNLITASAFGLSLGADLQGGVPPFRSSVQTGIYLACLQACGSTGGLSAGAGDEVEVHEIGRKGAHLLGYFSGGKWERHILGREAVKKPWKLERYAQRTILFGICVALILSAYAARPFDRKAALELGIFRDSSKRGGRPYLIILAGIAVLLWFMFLLTKSQATRGDAEPRNWLLGISSFPVIAGSVFAVGSAAVMMVSAWWRSRENLRELTALYPFGGAPSEDYEVTQEDIDRNFVIPGELTPSWWDWIGRIKELGPKIKGIRSLRYRIARFYTNVRPEKNPDLHTRRLTPLQASFALDGLASSGLNRSLRITAGLVLICLLWLVTDVPGNETVPPFVRGAIRPLYQWTDWLAKAALVITCLFAVDAQVRNGLANLKLRRLLQASGPEKSSPYPYGGRLDLPTEFLTAQQAGNNVVGSSRDVGLWELPLVRAVALRFQASAPVVTIPFTVLFCLIISRFQVFEGVTYPSSEILLYLLFLLAPLAAGAFAQYQMSAVFDVAGDRIRQGIAIHVSKLEEFCKTEADFLAKLEAKTSYSFFSNPLLKAVLLPLGSVGVLELITTLAPYLK